MKKYSEYSEKELDELYSKLSETAQDFIYSDVIKDEVTTIGKEIGLSIEYWEKLDTLIIETILGVVPSSMFRSEVSNRLYTTPINTDKIVAHMEENIFSVIREDSIDDYSASNEKNIEVFQNAIYDESLDDLTLDPYREVVGGSQNSSSPIITDEKLRIVDDLFAPYKPSPKSKKAIYEKNIRVELNPTKPDTAIITKETLAKLDGTFVESSALTDTTKEKLETPEKPSQKLILRFEKSDTPGKIKIKISNKTEGSKKISSSVSLDPYKELV